MKTLIELYDDRPLENILAALTFRPERVVYVCPEEVAASKHQARVLRRYYDFRGLPIQVEMLGASSYNAADMLLRLREAAEKYDDCVLDITGGTDAALFAAGQLTAELPMPVITYSRRRNSFFDISHSHAAEADKCDVTFSVDDFFLMAGGSVREGRVDNAVLEQYKNDIEPFFELFLRHRKKWNSLVTYMQRISQCDKFTEPPMAVQGAYQVKGEHGSRVNAPEEALRDLERIGFLSGLSIERGRSVSFRFRDAQIRTWLRDVGSVLELYVYQSCLDSRLFADVRTSVIVDWEGQAGRDCVTNELDVMAASGVIPVFISCKTCEVKTEALNELAILADRFGGQMAKAAIVTAERGGGAMRNRAAELGIAVIDLEDLQQGDLRRRLIELMRSGN